MIDDGLDLDDVCSGHATATKELAALRGELAALKSRSCAGCKWFIADYAFADYGDCRAIGSPVETAEPDFCCNKWEPKT